MISLPGQLYPVAGDGSGAQGPSSCAELVSMSLATFVWKYRNAYQYFWVLKILLPNEPNTVPLNSQLPFRTARSSPPVKLGCGLPMYVGSAAVIAPSPSRSRNLMRPGRAPLFQNGAASSEST